MKFNNLINLGIILSLILLAVSFFMVRRLPGYTAIDPALRHSPVQSDTGRDVFRFDYRGTNYTVQPMADYELWGLIVTHNDIGAWYNYYHDEDTVNLMDICVIWGDNLLGDFYRQVKYKSGEWTCYTKIADWDTWFAFKSDQISNNHLLAADPRVQELIRGLHRGDQVHLKGLLVGYGEAGTNYLRESSMSRSDKGNGACEVMFVDSLEVLKEGNPLWWQTYRFSRYALLFLIIVKIIYFFIFHRQTLFYRQKEAQP